ncbi:DUF6907 domain-containing protein [Granulicoccus phenolivorans]|uniref:DUF6907 domain-containing protein n=1 Tax=Granulicoccus phenolivorans TaxID=266854 RepID=UPI00041D7566|nr:hypothetical protein [Granulicoccus phenolivorans]
MTVTTESFTPPPTSCPSWCTLPAGHPWEHYYGLGATRYHSRKVWTGAAQRVEVLTQEVAYSATDVRTLGPHLSLGDDHGYVPLTALEARELAAALVEAAAELEGIEGTL